MIRELEGKWCSKSLHVATSNNVNSIISIPHTIHHYHCPLLHYPAMIYYPDHVIITLNI